MSQLVKGATTSSFVKHVTNLLSLWNIKAFLRAGGSVLVSIGTAGVMGALGSLSPLDLFHPPRWIHWLHLSFGVFVLLSSVRGDRKLQLGLAVAAAIGGTTVGVSGFAATSYAFLRAYPGRSPDFSDPLAHLVVGTLAILALRNSRRREALQ